MHTIGHEPTVVTGSFPAARLVKSAREVITDLSPDRDARDAPVAYGSKIENAGQHGGASRTGSRCPGPDRGMLMLAMDTINQRYGRGSVQLTSAGARCARVGHAAGFAHAELHH
jgi:hypothetical protein